MTKAQFTDSFSLLREIIQDFLRSPDNEVILKEACLNAAAENPFFTLPMQEFALRAIAEKFLTPGALGFLTDAVRADESSCRHVGIIMAGNIPAVGFLDLLCVLACGCNAAVKLSSKDRYIIPALCASIAERSPALKDALSRSVSFSCSRRDVAEFFSGADSILFSGSDDSAGVICPEFAGVRKLMRGSRFSFAVVSGEESDEQLEGLALDILLYCGLGCRSVSYLYLPERYDFGRLKEALETVGRRLGTDLIAPYRNAILRGRAVAAMSGRLSHAGTSCRADMIDCGSVLLEHSPEPFPPLGVVRFGYYGDILDIERFERKHIGAIQKKYTTFGDAQRPDIDEWPDGENIINFLCAK